MGMFKFMLVVAMLISLHYFVWKKVNRDWSGNVKGLLKVMLIIACLLIEAAATFLLGIYVLNI